MKDKVNYYLVQSKEYLRKAYKELELKELKQASEKFWGAASLAVKALAELKKWKDGGRWKHDTHGLLFVVVDKISKEIKDETLKKQFMIASMLHTNFYEGWLTEGEIKTGGEEVEKFVQKLENIIKNEY